MQPGPLPQQPASSKKFPTWAIVLIACGVGCLPVLGVLSALAIYGTRKYMAAAKTSEAKNTVGAISRAAAASYERNQTALLLLPDSNAPNTAKLCESAIPVPASVPKGLRYQPASTDFSTGSAAAGWMCLRFSIAQPIYYQYHYNQGGRYQAAANAPGPDGFEAAAAGDLDGDGTTSLFARSGRIDARGELVTSTSVYIDNELE